MTTIRIADFTKSPGGRYVADGPYSGEWFRNEVLVPALRDASDRHEVTVVELDGTSGYGSSFLEEAFGGLVRKRLVDVSALREHLKIVARTPLYAPYRELAEKYIASAKPEVVAA
jgi:hypothetical protein